MFRNRQSSLECFAFSMARNNILAMRLDLSFMLYVHTRAEGQNQGHSSQWITPTQEQDQHLYSVVPTCHVWL